MYIESIELKNFRNYQNLSMVFDEKTNILYGDNAQGKTNILESIYVCSTTKSHRAGKDNELIRFGQEDSHLKLILNRDGVPFRVDMHLKKNKAKGIAVNGIPVKKASELFGVINVVFFSPEDLNIIKNGPSERRRFIDMELCQLDKLYVFDLIQYNKIVMQRNKLLKDFKERSDWKDTLDIWDMQLSQYGKKIIERRSSFIRQLNKIIFDIHKKLTGDREELEIAYEPNVPEDRIYETLVKNRERDIKMKSTSVGPHRDDISFSIQDVDIRKYGSQGQQRTSALSLKLAEIELMKKVIKDTPVLLLDDVLSELDSNRQNYLLNSIDGVQTIITCTGLDEFIQNRFHINKIYKITDGRIDDSVSV